MRHASPSHPQIVNICEKHSQEEAKKKGFFSRFATVLSKTNGSNENLFIDNP